MAALIVACNDIYGPTDAPTPVVNSDGINITVSEVKDSSVIFTLAPKGESAYYSYLVDQSDSVETLDSSKLYKVSYKRVAQGTVKWADNNNKTLTVSGLAPNTPYVIYAVAGSTTGVPSAVSYATFKTSDIVAPSADVKYSATDSSIVLSYDEAIVKGSGDVTVKYYAINTTDIESGTPEGEVKAEVAVNGKTANINFTVPAGAYYTVDVAAGAFKDAAGNDCAAWTSVLYYDSEEEDFVGTGIYGRREPGSFTIGEAEQKILTDTSSPITADLGAEYGYGYTNSKAAVSLAYGNDTKVTTILLTAYTDYGYSSKSGKVMFYLPEEPARGNQVAVDVAAGAFEDIYGNTNEEWEAELLYAYDYTEDTVIGSYAGAYMSAFDGKTYGGTDVIAKSDDESKGNIMITSLCGMTFDKPVYATWNPQEGTITIPALSYCFSYTDEGVDYNAVISWASSKGGYSPTDPIVLEVPEAGTIQNTEMFGFLACKGSTPSSWYDIAYKYKAVKNESAGEAGLTAARSRDSKLYSFDAKILK